MIIIDLKLYLLHATSCDPSDMWSLAKFIQQHLRAVGKHNWKSLPPPGCSLNTWSNPREPELSTWPGHSGPLQPCTQATFQWLSPQTLAAHSKSHKVGILARPLAILKHIWYVTYVANWSFSTYIQEVQISIISTSSLPSPVSSQLGTAIQPTRWSKRWATHQTQLRRRTRRPSHFRESASGQASQWQRRHSGPRMSLATMGERQCMN